MTSNDLVVVLPGIMGSTLRGPDGKLFWAPSAGAVLRGVATFGKSIKRYELPEGIGDEHPRDGVQPVGLMPDLHALPGIWTPVKGYDRLVNHLTNLGYRPAGNDPDTDPGNLLCVPYDWRLSNRYNGQRLADIVEPALFQWRRQGGPYQHAKLIFVCHSMGGLIARWYVEKCGGADHTRKVITLGSPYRGAAKALDQLINGVRKGLGRLTVDLTAFARSLPSLHQLIPEYACIAHANTLLKTTEYAAAAGRPLPELNEDRLADAMCFHTDLQSAEATRPAAVDTTHMVIGVRQPTGTTMRVTADGAELLETIDGRNDYGDATVPLAGAVGFGLNQTSNRLRRVADQHGNLHRNRAAFDELDEVLTGEAIRRRAAANVPLRVRAPDLLLAGEPLPVSVDIDHETDNRHAVLITLVDEHGHQQSRQLRVRGGHTDTTFPALDPGAYTVHVTGLDIASPLAPVSSCLIVWSERDLNPHSG